MPADAKPCRSVCGTLWPLQTGTPSSAILYGTTGEHDLTVASTPNSFAVIAVSDGCSSVTGEAPQRVVRYKLNGDRHLRTQSSCCSAEIRY
ncbi:unnamed protein product [Rangifer tarandus platyrhynchus]|uniref:Uncharacterized protein n=1 Tax=Rangifer tarandus platyrhynchus TaxID=3082113 RepID=A0ABN8XN16_RANTA|nr:unnamed protein product [Rangifer tarandus platyrhynchus]